VERPSVQRRQAERRRLWDRRGSTARRAGDERRKRDRRSLAGAAPTERRRADRRCDERRDTPDRRVAQNRRRGRRRRETPTPYSPEEMSDLRARFAGPGPVRCPACGGTFTLGPGRRRGNEVARRVMCLACGRGAAIANSRPARVLLNHPHPVLRDTLYSMLASHGHEVVETADAAVALLAYQTVPADVVLIDVMAPGRMEAADFIRKLRRVFPDARVVAMAGRPSYREADPLAVVAGLGAVKTIRMPISRDELLRVIEEARL
jgi:CheY-like chemotaxis protein